LVTRDKMSNSTS